MIAQLLFSRSAILGNFFQIFNMILIISIIIYVFKNYIFTMMSHTQHEAAQEEKTLLNEKNTLAHRLTELQTLTHAHIEESIALRQKIAQWHSVCEQAQQKATIQHNLTQASLISRAQIQARYCAFIHTRTNLTKKIVTEAENQLKNHFHTGQAAQEYEQQIIHKLGE